MLNFESINYLRDIVTTLDTIVRSWITNSQSQNESYKYINYKVVNKIIQLKIITSKNKITFKIDFPIPIL